jgi:hypothetical protein
VAQAGDAATGSSATGRKRGAARLGGGLAGDEGGIWYASTPMHCEVVNGMNEVQVTRQTAGQDKKSFFKKKNKGPEISISSGIQNKHIQLMPRACGVFNGTEGSAHVSYHIEKPVCTTTSPSPSLCFMYSLAL